MNTPLQALRVPIPAPEAGDRWPVDPHAPREAPWAVWERLARGESPDPDWDWEWESPPPPEPPHLGPQPARLCTSCHGVLPAAPGDERVSWLWPIPDVCLPCWELQRDGVLAR